MTLRLSIPEAPSEADRDAVVAPLRAFNITHGGDPAIRPVAVLLTDGDGRHVGGLWGRSSYGWLHVELLAVPAEYRGRQYGRALMQAAEDIARRDGQIGMWLDTFEFQARGFYEKLGFELFGELEDHPMGQSHFFLRKRFA
jgi:GNAT superfamily N-acetyltransferase